MKNKVLTISTANPEKTGILIADRKGKIIDKKIWQPKQKQSEELLPQIDRLLRTNKMRTEDLVFVIVDIGPGSFTGTRVGVATANALSFALDISVVGEKHQDNIEDILNCGLQKYHRNKPKPGMIIKPVYFKQPNITKPKK